MTTEQKAWQLHENGVTYGELYMITRRDFDYDDPSKDISLDQAVEIKWEELFGSGRLK